MMRRLEAVDYLRGVCALGVLVYHYTRWSGVEVPALARVGVYAVSAFYVISGISFGYVHRNLRTTGPELLGFYIKRACRLLPLYWLAIAGTLLVAGAFPAWDRILLNITLAFGVVAPDAYLPVGGWSIGNEVAFYLSFPFVVLFARRGSRGLIPIAVVSAGIAAWFAFAEIPTATEDLQWLRYVNPLNQWVLFVAGVWVATSIGRSVLSARQSYGALVVVLSMFWLLPGATFESLVTGWLRVAYVTVVVTLGAIVAWGTFPMPALGARALEFLGRTSYAIYLLHPVVYRLTGFLGTGLARAVGSAIVTLALSHVVYRTIEAPAIRLGKRLANADWAAQRSPISPRKSQVNA